MRVVTLRPGLAWPTALVEALVTSRATASEPVGRPLEPLQLGGSVTDSEERSRSRHGAGGRGSFGTRRTRHGTEFAVRIVRTTSTSYFAHTEHTLSTCLAHW